MVAASAAWGTSGIFVKFVTLEGAVSALALAFWRDITAFTVLVVALGVLRPGWLRVPRAKLGWLVAMGASLGIFHVFWNLAVMLNGAAVATVQQAGVLSLLPQAFVHHPVRAGLLASLPAPTALPMAPIGLMRPSATLGESAQGLYEFLLRWSQASSMMRKA